MSGGDTVWLTPSLSDAKFKHQGLMEKSDHVESSPTLPPVKFDCKKTIPTHLVSGAHSSNSLMLTFDF